MERKPEVYYLSFLLLLSVANLTMAQPAQKFIRNGNAAYQEGKYKEAEIGYRKALDKEPNSVKATYNLGNSQYKQQNFEESLNSYLKLAADEKNRKMSQLYHNLGNSYLQTQKYTESIDAYKKALRLNPKDEDTRYNLAYAMTKLQQQKNNQQNNEDKQNQQNKQQQQQQDQRKEQKQNQNMSKEDAERMLNALKNNEKRTMDKVKKQQAKPVISQPEKDW
jgi:tetratricopeptide (TPR) repeat protein